MRLRIVLFDIDGTLTATTSADNDCYDSAFGKCFGFPLPTTDWHQYTHVTDIGIIQEVMECTGRPAADMNALNRFEELYEGELARSYAQHPGGFVEIPGARKMLDSLAADDGVVGALATGGMRRTALFKLRRIGVDGTSMPGAFANDAISRVDIARIAIERAGVASQDVVYVGDGAWDVATAAALRMRFVGICHEYARERLIAAGAGTVIEDFANLDAAHRAIDTATVPKVR